MKRSNPSGSRGETPRDGPVPGAGTRVDEKEAMQPYHRREIGGPPRPEPTRCRDGEKVGCCIDF